jgi:hypothetical protein
MFYGEESPRTNKTNRASYVKLIDKRKMQQLTSFYLDPRWLDNLNGSAPE